MPLRYVAVLDAVGVASGAVVVPVVVLYSPEGRVNVSRFGIVRTSQIGQRPLDVGVNVVRDDECRTAQITVLIQRRRSVLHRFKATDRTIDPVRGAVFVAGTRSFAYVPTVERIVLALSLA